MSISESDKLIAPLTYRGYVFVNTALSSIQKGVQGAHAVAELFVHYHDLIPNIEGADALYAWGSYDKTLIFLDGGFHGSLNENYQIFSSLCDKLQLPHALFQEDEGTLNCATTAFAGIVPSTVFDITDETMLEFEGYADLLRKTRVWSKADEELQAKCELKQFLNQFRLAI